jgi:protein SCO1/2
LFAKLDLLLVKLGEVVSPRVLDGRMKRLEGLRELLTLTNGPANWHLLALSIDPGFDIPAVLKAYGASYGQNPERWTLATGALMDITAIAEQLGLEFWREAGGGISHNLRTVVIDPTGRVRKILIGNKWTSEEFTAEIIGAAAQDP